MRQAIVAIRPGLRKSTSRGSINTRNRWIMYLQYKALRYNESFKDGAGLLWGYETLGELTVLRTNGSKYKEIYSR